MMMNNGPVNGRSASIPRGFLTFGYPLSAKEPGWIKMAMKERIIAITQSHAHGLQ